MAEEKKELDAEHQEMLDEHNAVTEAILKNAGIKTQRAKRAIELFRACLVATKGDQESARKLFDTIILYVPTVLRGEVNG